MAGLFDKLRRKTKVKKAKVKAKRNKRQREREQKRQRRQRKKEAVADFGSDVGEIVGATRPAGAAKRTARAARKAGEVSLSGAEKLGDASGKLPTIEMRDEDPFGDGGSKSQQAPEMPPIFGPPKKQSKEDDEFPFKL